MKFEEVLPALREGKRIRLKEWEKIEYVYVPKNETELRAEDGQFVNLSWKDFFSDDWEIIKEKKKVKFRYLTEKQFETWGAKNCYYTKCVNCPFSKVYCDLTSKNNWINNKDLYSDKFLNQEIEIEEE